MSGASTHILIAYDAQPLAGLDRTQPCNKCASGQIIDIDHFLLPPPTYQLVECPLCGRTSIKTRARVKRSAILTSSP